MGLFDIRDIGHIPREKAIRFWIWLSGIILLTILLFFLGFLDVGFVAYKICILITLAVFIGELAVIYLESDRRMTPLILFLIAFYLFQNGQILLWALGINFDAFYLLYLQKRLNGAIILSSVCNLWAGFAGMLCSMPRRDLQKVRIAPQDRYDRRLVYRSLGIACVVLGVVVIPVVFARFAAVLYEGDSGVRALNERTPGILSFLEYLFVPFCVAFICYFGKRKIGKLAAGVLTGYFVLNAFCGERATGLAGIFVLFFLFGFLEKDRKKRRLRFGLLVIVCVALLFLIQFVRIVRDQEASVKISLRLWDVLVGLIWEIGFGFIPLMAMMEIVPASESFLLGRQYLQSVVSGVLPVPAGSDGTVAKIHAASRIFERWEIGYFPFLDLSPAFSLNAEGYINFGSFGFLSVFLICILIAFFLNRYQWYEEDCMFPKYVACVLILLWFTLPGRSSGDVWKALFCSVVLLSVYLWLTCAGWRKHTGQAE